jgi:hypothetical protein
MGRFEEGLKQAQEALQLPHDSEAPYRRMLDAYICTDRLAEAHQTAEAVRTQGIDGSRIHQRFLEMGYVEGDKAAIDREIQWFAGKPEEYLSFGLQAANLNVHGQRRASHDLYERASAATLLEVAADPRHLGVQPGFLSILHTWGQTLTPHPHIHCVIPGGGLAPDHSRWISSRSSFLPPVKVLSRVFRGKFVAGLRRLFARDQLRFFGECVPLHNQKRFAVFLRRLYRQDWVVYAKPPFGGPEHVLHYLARYTHRVAISNHRLLSVSAAEVCFRWKDYAHHGRQRTLTRASEEFLRRFVQHVLPRGFPRIRYFGFLANRRRACMLPLCRALLCQASPAESPCLAKPLLWKCSRCHGLMHLVERITAAQLFFTEHKKEYRLDSS